MQWNKFHCRFLRQSSGTGWVPQFTIVPDRAGGHSMNFGMQPSIWTSSGQFLYLLLDLSFFTCWKKQTELVSQETNKTNDSSSLSPSGTLVSMLQLHICLKSLAPNLTAFKEHFGLDSEKPDKAETLRPSLLKLMFFICLHHKRINLPSQSCSSPMVLSLLSLQQTPSCLWRPKTGSQNFPGQRSGPGPLRSTWSNTRNPSVRSGSVTVLLSVWWSYKTLNHLNQWFLIKDQNQSEIQSN